MPNKPSRILVCGGRDYFNYYELTKVLNALVPHFAKKFCIIHGNAPGADRMAGHWAQERGTCVVTVDANWDYYGDNAGTIRNEWMAQFCMPELCIHFPGGRGTGRMVETCKRLGIPTHGAI